MDNDSLSYLDKSSRSELWAGPILVIVNKGFCKNALSITLQKGTYSFAYDQVGIMGESGIRGHENNQNPSVTLKKDVGW